MWLFIHVSKRGPLTVKSYCPVLIINCHLFMEHLNGLHVLYNIHQYVFQWHSGSNNKELKFGTIEKRLYTMYYSHIKRKNHFCYKSLIMWPNMYPLHWRHNERDCVLSHWRFSCLLNCLFRCRSKKTSKLRVNGLCEGNYPVTTGEFPAQRASNAENVSIWWRYHINNGQLISYRCMNYLMHELESWSWKRPQMFMRLGTGNPQNMSYIVLSLPEDVIFIDV